MIDLRVDEGYAFDYLSILEVKDNYIRSKESKVSFQKCLTHLKDQLGNEVFNEIYRSNEYNDCYNANELTFEAVEKARYGEISAKEVDECNMKRFKAKIQLQNKFFKEKTSEQKT